MECRHHDFFSDVITRTWLLMWCQQHFTSKVCILVQIKCKCIGNNIKWKTSEHCSACYLSCHTSPKATVSVSWGSCIQSSVLPATYKTQGTRQCFAVLLVMATQSLPKVHPNPLQRLTFWLLLGQQSLVLTRLSQQIPELLLQAWES